MQVYRVARSGGANPRFSIKRCSVCGAAIACASRIMKSELSAARRLVMYPAQIRFRSFLPRGMLLTVGVRLDGQIIHQTGKQPRIMTTGDFASPGNIVESPELRRVRIAASVERPAHPLTQRRHALHIEDLNEFPDTAAAKVRVEDRHDL